MRVVLVLPSLLLLTLSWRSQAVPLGTKTVPGCPDLDSLENQAEFNQENFKNLLLCFCKADSKSNVAISCLYGSNYEHLERATMAVKNASMVVKQLTIQHMDFQDDKFPDIAKMAPELVALEIRECGSLGPLNVTESALEPLSQTLVNLTIRGCHMEKIPSIISKLPSLEFLDIGDNKIEKIMAEDLGKKEKLIYLDLSKNLIMNAEEGSFDSISNLETLVIGERNYMNETVLEEISKLKNLKTLDLGKADGVFEPPMAAFANLAKLETLKMSGCGIQTIDAGAFSPLKNLRQLDLRVNLIENISAYAFDGLSHLERMALAGNYIRNLDKDVWVGLESLKDLDLSWNDIKEIPEGLFAPLAKTLKVLNLKHIPIKKLPPTGLVNLEDLNLSECEFEPLSPDTFKEYKNLKVLNLAGSNVTTIPENMLQSQADSLINLNLQKANLRTLSPKLLTDLKTLEVIDVSQNKFLCDSELAKFIFAVEDRLRDSAKDGKDFLFANANDTLCDRPYSLRFAGIMEVQPQQLQPYDESTDTTTTTTTTTPSSVEEAAESTTPLVIPDIFIGSKSNESIFKEEPKRPAYDLTTHDDPRYAEAAKNQGNSFLWPVTIGVLVVISLIAIVAVAMFRQKKKKVGAAEANKNAKKPSSIEDGMVEIELDAKTKPPNNNNQSRS